MFERRKTRIIFVGGLNFETKEDTLRKVFSKFGNVEEVTFSGRENEKHRGFAFLTMDTPEAAAAAVAKDGLTIDNNIIKIEFYREKRRKPFPRRNFDQYDDGDKRGRSYNDGDSESDEDEKRKKKHHHKRHHKRSKRRSDYSDSESESSDSYESSESSTESTDSSSSSSSSKSSKKSRKSKKSESSRKRSRKDKKDKKHRKDKKSKKSRHHKRDKSSSSSD